MPVGIRCVGISSVVIIIFVNESSVRVSERCSCFCFLRQVKSKQIYIYPFASLITNKINLECGSGSFTLTIFLIEGNTSNIYLITIANQMVIYDILHDMSWCQRQFLCIYTLFVCRCFCLPIRDNNPSTSTPRCEAINKKERTDACAGSLHFLQINVLKPSKNKRKL